MAFDLQSAAFEIEASLRRLGTAERAAQEKRYLKSDLAFLGATVWQIRAVVKDFSRERALDHDQVVDLATALWSEPIHERRMAAVALLEQHSRLLAAGDLPLVERLIRESRTWALVDGLAANVAGDIRAADPSVESTLDTWARDSDFWVRRASLLAELRPLREGAPLEPFLRRADAMLEEREFFIRKAIGWVLREVGKRRPADVVAWLSPRTARASGVTMREAVRHLPPDDAERLMTAYRGGRTAAKGTPKVPG